jgi:hypothetical protein
VAVATPEGFRPQRFGDSAFQEWLPAGVGSLYVALLSDKSKFKSFKSFVASLKDPQFDQKELSIKFDPKEKFEFSWKGSLLVNGVSDALKDGLPEMPPRLDNPAVNLTATDSILRAKFAGARLELDILNGKRLYPASRA